MLSHESGRASLHPSPFAGNLLNTVLNLFNIYRKGTTMSRRRTIAVLTLAFVAIAFPSCRVRADEALAAKIRSIIAAPEYKGSRWGILAVDLETKQPVYALNADMLFAPASVTKLFSCSAAFLAIGPDTRYETPVYRRGELDKGVLKGVLKGDLILLAQGDLTLGGRTTADGKLAFKNHDHIYAGYLSTDTELTDTDPLAGLNDLARQIKRSGIVAISGDVLIDDRLFDKARGSGSGPGIVTPIMVNDNILDITVTPGTKAGETATIKVRPETALYKVESKVVTLPWWKVAQVGVELAGPGRIRVTGMISANMKPVVRIYSVGEPALFARGLFIEALRREGVEIKADPKKAPTAKLPESEAYAKLPRVAQLESAPCPSC